MLALNVEKPYLNSVNFKRPLHKISFKQQVLFFRLNYLQAKLKLQLGNKIQVFIPTTSAITQTLIIKQKGFNQRGTSPSRGYPNYQF